MQNAAAAAPTTGVLPAAADEVSALTAAQFGTHAQMYQAISAQAAAIHQMFVDTLGTSAGSYATTEAANAIAARLRARTPMLGFRSIAAGDLNSGRMYTGPGPGSMLAAAAAWQSLAEELTSAASGYGSVVSTLTSGSWTGPSSISMAAAAAPYVTWLSATADHGAQQAATQATAAASAYESAFAATVPPPIIEANRSLLAALVATNVLGQNTPAIAATEALYGEMWAQDATAMYWLRRSLGNGNTSDLLSPRRRRPPTRAACGEYQSVAAAQSAGTSGGTDLDTFMSSGPQVISGMHLRPCRAWRRRRPWDSVASTATDLRRRPRHRQRRS